SSLCPKIISNLEFMFIHVSSDSHNTIPKFFNNLSIDKFWSEVIEQLLPYKKSVPGWHGKTGKGTGLSGTELMDQFKSKNSNDDEYLTVSDENIKENLRKRMSTITHSLLSSESDDFSLQIKFHDNSIYHNFESLINELKIWKRIESTLEMVNVEVNYFRIQKIENGIPLGQYANPVCNRKWIRFQIESIFNLKATKSD
ncbi:1092_t:CDS:2, partial [Scutellospora calospora]